MPMRSMRSRLGSSNTNIAARVSSSMTSPASITVLVMNSRSGKVDVVNVAWGFSFRRPRSRSKTGTSIQTVSMLTISRIASPACTCSPNRLPTLTTAPVIGARTSYVVVSSGAFNPSTLASIAASLASAIA